jgi:gamma-glutamyl-gamma-aminobutyrate hydrolase PuuD
VVESAESRPVVGITTYLEEAAWGVWARRAALLPEAYLLAVSAAGGVPVLLPPQRPAGARSALSGVDALVLAGGADIDPAAYRALPRPETTNTRPDRDAWDVALLREALSLDLPLLGVCRGMQLINVALGGDLDQHLPASGALPAHQPGPGRFGRHRVRLADRSVLGAVLGDEVEVASYHHQGVGRLGTGTTAVGWADDGVVEAIEVGGPRFAVGVLWHPEEHEEFTLFEALVAAAAPTRHLRFDATSQGVD